MSGFDGSCLATGDEPQECSSNYPAPHLDPEPVSGGALLFAFELMPGACLQLPENKAIQIASDISSPCIMEESHAQKKLHLLFFSSLGGEGRVYYLLLFSRSVLSNSLQPHGLQHARLPYPLPSSGVCSNSCPLSH